jgi:hypothetical protein
MPEAHKIVEASWLVYATQPADERAVVERHREGVLDYFRKQRARLAADPTATEDDLGMLDSYIRWTENKLGEQERRDERRRMKTRERVARWRRAARKQPA